MKTVRILTKAILLMVLLLLFTQQAFAGVYSGGMGSASKPWLISKPNDILEMSDTSADWGDYFEMTNDIDMSGQPCFDTAVIAPDTDNASYYYDGTPFTGFFDGGGFEIQNLCIDTGTVNNHFLGLFGKIDGEGEIKGLGLSEVYIKGGNISAYIGALAGENTYTSSITSCWSSGWVEKGGAWDDHTSEIGGLVGQANNLSYCYSTCTVKAGDRSWGVGGLAGSGSNITCSYHDGDVNTGDYMMEVGGLVGAGGEINYCYSAGTLTTGIYPDRVGGLAGMYGGYPMTDCYSTVHIIGEYPCSAAGLVGYNFLANVDNCYATGPIDVTGYKYAVVYNFGGTVTDCFYNSDLIVEPWLMPMGADPLDTNDMKTSDPFIAAGWDFTDIWMTVQEGEYYPQLRCQPEITECNIYHVDDIKMTLSPSQGGKGKATITVADCFDDPVEGVTVVGQWSGLASDSDSGETDSDGQVKFQSDPNSASGFFTITIVYTNKANWTYDEDASVTTASIEND